MNSYNENTSEMLKDADMKCCVLKWKKGSEVFRERIYEYMGDHGLQCLLCQSYGLQKYGKYPPLCAYLLHQIPQDKE
jgi:hypothetical protein